MFAKEKLVESDNYLFQIKNPGGFRDFSIGREGPIGWAF